VILVAGLILAAMPASAMADSDRPHITRAPSLTGTAQVGQRLQAVGAAWTGRQPLSASYYWLRCDTEGWRDWDDCGLIDGQRSTSYVLTAADLGKYLRAAVAVTNRDGFDIEVSRPTAAVAAVPVPANPPQTPTSPPAVAPPVAVPAPPTVPAAPQTPAASAERALRMMRPAPLVRIRGWLTTSGAMISHLSVRAPRGARVSVRCHGRGCPRKSLARMTKLTRLGAFEHRLRAGTRLVISVTRAGFIGKHTVIRIRRGKAPTRRDLCLYPGSKGPAKCPAG
jgi:hypothetical protein